jgi:hypothetical protein
MLGCMATAESSRLHYKSVAEETTRQRQDSVNITKARHKAAEYSQAAQSSVWKEAAEKFEDRAEKARNIGNVDKDQRSASWAGRGATARLI